MKNKKFALATSILVVAIAALLLALFPSLFGQGYDFAVEQGSTVFYSNGSHPDALLKAIASRPEIMVSAAMPEKGSQLEFLHNASALFVVVLVGNDKNAVALYRVFDSSGKLLDCRTNHGDPTKDDIVPKEACEAILKEDFRQIVFIEQPDASLQKNKVVVTDNSITITPKSWVDASTAALSTLKAMFPNALEIIDRTNKIASNLK